MFTALPGELPRLNGLAAGAVEYLRKTVSPYDFITTVRDVLRLVLGSAVRLTAVGLAIGLGAAAILSRWLTTLVFPVTPLDPVTFALVPVVLVITAAIAVAAPAIRATRIDPVVAFRNE